VSPRISVYSDRVAYERLADFARNLMKRPRIYQPVMLMTLLPKMTYALPWAVE
jgi:hypothetical protein